MAIYRKKGNAVWYASIYIRETGRTLNVSTRTRVESEARAVERALKAAHNRAIRPDKLHAIIDALCGAKPQEPQGIPLAGAYDAYARRVEALGNAPSHHTLVARRNSLARLVRWRDANSPACVYAGELTRSVAGRFAEALDADDTLSDKTKHDALADLGTVWAVLMSVDEGIRENPWRYFRKAVVKQRRGRAFTPDEERRILAAAGGTEWRTASLISRWTGLRFGDVCALTWAEVDWTDGAIRLDPSKTKRFKITVVIPLAPALRDELERVRGAEGPILPVLKSHYPHPQRAPFGSFADVLERAKIDRTRRFHDWRHTFASRLADAGVSTEIIKKMGGWTQDGTALRYQHSDRIAELRGAIDAMARLAAGGGNQSMPSASAVKESANALP